MKVRVQIDFTSTADNTHRGVALVILETDVGLNPDIQFNLPPWQKPKKLTSATYEGHEGEIVLNLWFATEERPLAADCEALIEDYESAGWAVTGKH